MDIRKSLGIKRNERKSIMMLIGYSFFMGLAIAFYFTATISDFLVHFDIGVLPYTYMLSGVLGYFLWLLWSVFEKKFEFSTRLMIGINFLLISVVLLFAGVLFLENAWLSFLMLVWVRVFIFVNMVNFWGMAGKLFNISQGKRLFGLISVGTVMSDIVGFFSIPLILYLGMHNDGLILLSILSLSVCLVFTYIITTRFSRHLKSPVDTEILEVSKLRKRGPLFKNNYQKYLFYLAILPMFGFYFVDFLFLDRIKINFADYPDAIAGFMGRFFGVVALVELGVKSGVFNRILYNYGLKIALLILPTILLISTGFGLTVGVWPWAMGFIFPAIAFTKLLEKALRSGINDPSFQILYQPIPFKERLAFQSKMEGVPTALGNIAAGGLILLLIEFDLTDSVWLNLIFILVILLWIVVAKRAHQEYKGVIHAKLQGNELEMDSDNRLSFVDHLVELFRKGNIEVALRSLKLLDLTGRGISMKLLKRLENHDSMPVQIEVEAIAQRYKTNEPLVDSNLANASIGVGINDDALNRLLLSDKVSDKLSAIQLLKSASNVLGLKNSLKELLLDEHNEVVHAALSILPEELDEHTAQFIIDNLDKNTLNQIAMPILKKQGTITEHLIIRKLIQYETGQWSSLYQQRASLQLILILKEIGQTESQHYMLRLLEFGNSEVKEFALDALASLGLPPGGFDTNYFLQKIEKEVGHITWLLASIEDLSKDRPKYDELIESLKAEGLRARDRLFSFLSFLYPKATIEQIRFNMVSGEIESNVIALEMCEIILSSELKSMLNPILMDISVGEKLRGLSKDFPQKSLPPKERIKDIIYYDFSRVNSWIKILSMSYLIDSESDIPREIYANIHINNPMIKEQAYLTMHAINRTEFLRKIVDESLDFQIHLNRIIGADPGMERIDSMLMRIRKLKQISFFYQLNEIILIKIAYVLQKMELEGDNNYCKHYPDYKLIFFVITGSLDIVLPNSDVIETYTAGDVMGIYSDIDLRTARFNARPNTEIQAVRKDYFFTLVSVYDELFERLIHELGILNERED